ncbi:MAG: hypothetical protein Kow0069_02720 [Promethearchaeota archaeon]
MKHLQPAVAEVLVAEGELSDEMDYALANFVANNLGFGFTPCQPQLVKLEDGREVIRVGLDHTFVNKDNVLMGYGIVGYVFVDPETSEVIYCPSKEEVEENVQILLSEGVEPRPRPRGKY